MEEDLRQLIEKEKLQLDRIEQSVNKIRSYLFWTFVVTVAVIVLPIIGLMVVIPRFLHMYSNLGV